MIPLVTKIAKDVVTMLLSHLKEVFKDYFEKKIDDFQRNLNNKYIEKQFLNQQELVEIAQRNIVPGSNQICAWLTKNEKTYTIFLAYAKNKELLPEKNNKYIAIESEGISRDIENLFGENELIILQ